MTGTRPVSIALKGATGFTVGAPTLALVHRSYRVRALTRRPPIAYQELVGVEWIQSEVADPAALDTLAAGVGKARKLPGGRASRRTGQRVPPNGRPVSPGRTDPINSPRWRRRARYVAGAASLLFALGASIGAQSRPSVPLPGINLAGGEFHSIRKPGVYGTDYIYPDSRAAAPFVEAGMKIVRVPILWERIQPNAHRALDAIEMNRLDQSIAQLGDFAIIVIDVSNFGKLRGVRLDRISDGSAALADLWTRLATHYGSNPSIAFGLMNEPNGIPASRWRTMVDQSVSAIRATGASNLILVPGTAWTAAHSWLSGGNTSNAVAFQNFRDPGDNFAFEMHQYVDADSSGTHTTCVDPTVAAQRLRPATNWLRQHRFRAYLGEFGAAANADCLRALSALLTELYRSPDVWIGWSYWAGGNWWGKYPLSVQPSGSTQKPQMTVLKAFIARTRP